MQGLNKKCGGSFRKLTELDTGDLVVFYESLRLFTNFDEYDVNNVTPDGLFIIGFFRLERPPISICPDHDDISIIKRRFSDDISIIKRRFRGHPLFDYYDALYWDGLFRCGSVFIAGDSSYGLFDRAFELSSYEEKEENYWPLNTFLRVRWGLDRSLMRTNALTVKNPEQVEEDLTNWMTDPINTSRDLKKLGWDPKFNSL